MQIYPIKFDPILKEKIWGGEKLKQLLNKETAKEDIGESWEISGVPVSVSVVSNGTYKGKNIQELLTDFPADLLGEKNFEKYGEKFPLLIKFIDANAYLSVQLHPDDRLSMQRHNSFGKTEMWYIMQADEGAEINVGFNKEMQKKEYLQALEEKKLVDYLHFEPVKTGDSFFIHPGKVHAIGAGVLLAEIQQSSDITYRIYDWDRTDAEGNSRELHTALALDAIDFEHKQDFQRDYENRKNQASQIASCPYFTTNFLPVSGNITRDYQQLDSFVVFMCVSGKAKLQVGDASEAIKKGETILIPAQAQSVQIEAEACELLEVYVE